MYVYKYIYIYPKYNPLVKQLSLGCQGMVPSAARLGAILYPRSGLMSTPSGAPK